jgi:hypothetical protein
LDFKGPFPVLYAVVKDVTHDPLLFGAHSVVLPGTAAALSKLMKKRKRGEDPPDLDTPTKQRHTIKFASQSIDESNNL